MGKGSNQKIKAQVLRNANAMRDRAVFFYI